MLGHCFVFILSLFGGNIKIYLVLSIVEWCGTFEVYLFAACPCFCLDYDCVLTHFVSVLSEILVWTWANLAGCVVYPVRNYLIPSKKFLIALLLDLWSHYGTRRTSIVLNTVCDVLLMILVSLCSFFSCLVT